MVNFNVPPKVPVVGEVPNVEAGVARIYARDLHLYALFPNGTEKKLTGAVGDVERDLEAPDAVHVSDALSQILRVDDIAAVADAADLGPIRLVDSAATSDNVSPVTLDPRATDILVTNDAGRSVLEVDMNDTFMVSDFPAVKFRLPESVGVSDPRQDALIEVVDWAATVESNTNFLTQENAIDRDDFTVSILNAQQTAISGSVTTTGEITVSMTPYTITPPPETVSAKLVWGWQTGSSGLLQSNNSVDVAVQYSLDNGATFTTIMTIISTINASADIETTINATYAELQQLQFRLTGSVTSGTATAVNARQFCGIRFARAEINYTQTL
jgi:hypothetical protein